MIGVLIDHSGGVVRRILVPEKPPLVVQLAAVEPLNMSEVFDDFFCAQVGIERECQRPRPLPAQSFLLESVCGDHAYYREQRSYTLAHRRDTRPLGIVTAIREAADALEVDVRLPPTEPCD